MKLRMGGGRGQRTYAVLRAGAWDYLEMTTQQLSRRIQMGLVPVMPSADPQWIIVPGTRCSHVLLGKESGTSPIMVDKLIAGYHASRGLSNSSRDELL
jgi:hypothetical protein